MKVEVTYCDNKNCTVQIRDGEVKIVDELTMEIKRNYSMLNSFYTKKDLELCPKCYEVISGIFND